VRFSVLFCLLTITAMPVAAQRPVPVVAGEVTDSAGTPIANALVVVPGTKLAVYTDRAGRYKFDSLPGHSVSLRVGFIGYGAQVRDSVPVVHGRTTRVDIRLIAAFQNGDIDIIQATLPTPPDSE
jgi:hypothetical protein